MEDASDSLDPQVHQYHDRSTALHTGLARYLNNRLFSDLTVVAPDGRRLLCHQLVLSACSKRFAVMLEEGTLAGKELPVWGVNSDALEAVIRFFYTGECTLTLPAVLAILDASQRLEVLGLVAACEAFMKAALGPQNVCALLGQALELKADGVVEECLRFISSRFEDVVTCDDFLSCPFATLARILASPQVTQQQPELSVFKAAWAWLLSDMGHAQHMQALLKLVKVPSGGYNDLISMAASSNRGGAVAGAAGVKTEGASVREVQHNGVSSRPLDLSGGGSSGLQLGGLSLGGGSLGGGAAGGTAGADASSVEATGQLPPVSGAAVASALAGVGLTEGLQALQHALAGAAPGLPLLGDANGDRAGSNHSGQLHVLLAAAARGGQQQQQQAQQQAALPLLPPLNGVSGNGSAWSAGDIPASSTAVAGLALPDLLPRLPLAPGLPVPSYPQVTGTATGAGWDGSHAGDPSARGERSGSALGRHAPVQGAFERQGYQQEQQHRQHHGQQHGQLHSEDGGGDVEEDRSPRNEQDSPTGRGSGRGGGSHMHRSGASKGVCQVEGCRADLKGLRDYHMRYKICEHHLKISSIVRDGKPQRFCQQCGRFHLLTDFDGNKRSCRARLQRHNARRRKRPGEDDTLGSPTGGNKRARGVSSTGGSGPEDHDEEGAAGGGMGGGMDGGISWGMDAGMVAGGVGRGVAAGVGGNGVIGNRGGGVGRGHAAGNGSLAGSRSGSGGMQHSLGALGGNAGAGAGTGGGAAGGLHLGGVGVGRGTMEGGGGGGGGGSVAGLPRLGVFEPQQFMQAIKAVAKQQGLDPNDLPQMLLNGLAAGNSGPALHSTQRNGAAGVAGGGAASAGGNVGVLAVERAPSGAINGLQLGSPRGGFGASAGGLYVGGGSNGTLRSASAATPAAAPAAAAGGAGNGPVPGVPAMLAGPGGFGRGTVTSNGPATAAAGGGGGGRGTNWGLDILANVAQHNVVREAVRKEQRPPSAGAPGAPGVEDTAEVPIMSWGPKGRRSGASRKSDGGHATSPNGSHGSMEHTSQRQQSQQWQQQQGQQGEEANGPQQAQPHLQQQEEVEQQGLMAAGGQSQARAPGFGVKEQNAAAAAPGGVAVASAGEAAAF